MAKGKNKKNKKKKKKASSPAGDNRHESVRSTKEKEPSAVVTKAAAAYAAGNFNLVRTLHEGELTGDDRKLVDSLYEKTLTHQVPWMIAAAATIITIIVGLLTLS